MGGGTLDSNCKVAVDKSQVSNGKLKEALWRIKHSITQFNAEIGEEQRNETEEFQGMFWMIFKPGSDLLFPVQYIQSQQPTRAAAIKSRLLHNTFVIKWQQRSPSISLVYRKEKKDSKDSK